MWGSLSSHVLPGVLVSRRQGGHGLIACFILFFSNGFLICPKNILRVQLLQSLGKNVSWNQDHLFKERDSSKPGKFKDEVSASISDIIALSTFRNWKVQHQHACPFFLKLTATSIMSTPTIPISFESWPSFSFLQNNATDLEGLEDWTRNLELLLKAEVLENLSYPVGFCRVVLQP